jgi:hypothetical protein
MLDEIITEKLSLWAQRGLDDSFYVNSNREIIKEKRLSKIKQNVSRNISKKSINKQLSLF